MIDIFVIIAQILYLTQFYQNLNLIIINILKYLILESFYKNLNL